MISINPEDLGSKVYPCQYSFQVAYRENGKERFYRGPVFFKNPTAEQLSELKADIERRMATVDAEFTGHNPIITDNDNNAQNYLECDRKIRIHNSQAIQEINRCSQGSRVEFCTMLSNAGVTRNKLDRLKQEQQDVIRIKNDHYKYVMIATAIRKHEERFPESSQSKSWRTDQMRELSSYYGSVPVAENLYDQDIELLQDIEDTMIKKGYTEEEKREVRIIIVRQISKVDNPNGFLNLVHHQVTKEEPH